MCQSRTPAQATLSLRDVQMPATQLAYHCVPLEAGRRDGDLTPNEPVLADAHLREKLRQWRKLGHVPHRAAHGGASGHVLSPHVVHRLACDGQPAARLTRDLDQWSTTRRQMIEARTADSD